jgi:hypothetical protein
MKIQDTVPSTAEVIIKAENLIKRFNLETIEHNQFKKVAKGVVKKSLVKVTMYYSNKNSKFKPSVVIHNLSNQKQIVKF